MNLKDVQNLISAPLKPNPSEWAMDVEEVLTDTNKLSEGAKTAIYKTKIHNGAFQNYIGNLVSVRYGNEMWTESFRKQLNR